MHAARLWSCRKDQVSSRLQPELRNSIAAGEVLVAFFAGMEENRELNQHAAQAPGPDERVEPGDKSLEDLVGVLEFVARIINPDVVGHVGMSAHQEQKGR